MPTFGEALELSGIRSEADADRTRVRLPADDADPAAAPDPLGAEDLAERPRPLAWLAGQAQILGPLPTHPQRRRARDAIALVADQDRRVTVRTDDEDRLLEPGVEAAEVREVRAVLPVRLDD